MLRFCAVAIIFIWAAAPVAAENFVRCNFELGLCGPNANNDKFTIVTNSTHPARICSLDEPAELRYEDHALCFWEPENADSISIRFKLSTATLGDTQIVWFSADVMTNRPDAVEMTAGNLSASPVAAPYKWERILLKAERDKSEEMNFSLGLRPDCPGSWMGIGNIVLASTPPSPPTEFYPLPYYDLSISPVIEDPDDPAREAILRQKLETLAGNNRRLLECSLLQYAIEHMDNRVELQRKTKDDYKAITGRDTPPKIVYSSQYMREKNTDATRYAGFDPYTGKPRQLQGSDQPVDESAYPLIEIMLEPQLSRKTLKQQREFFVKRGDPWRRKASMHWMQPLYDGMAAWYCEENFSLDGKHIGTVVLNSLPKIVELPSALRIFRINHAMAANGVMTIVMEPADVERIRKFIGENHGRSVVVSVLGQPRKEIQIHMLMPDFFEASEIYAGRETIDDRLRQQLFCEWLNAMSQLRRGDKDIKPDGTKVLIDLRLVNLKNQTEVEKLNAFMHHGLPSLYRDTPIDTRFLPWKRSWILTDDANEMAITEIESAVAEGDVLAVKLAPKDAEKLARLGQSLSGRDITLSVLGTPYEIQKLSSDTVRNGVLRISNSECAARDAAVLSAYSDIARERRIFPVKQ